MANRITAINAYRPKIVLGPTVQNDQLAAYIADRTGLNRGDIRHMLSELQDAEVFFSLNGQGTKLEGLGTFLPKISLDGKFGMSVRLSREINARLNQANAFKGTIKNRENINKTPDELVALWNAEHPDDLVV